MYKLILPIIGVSINVLMYRLLPYDGEFGLLIFIGLIVSTALGFIFGLVIDNIKRKRLRYLAIAFSIIALIVVSWWIFPFN